MMCTRIDNHTDCFHLRLQCRTEIETTLQSIDVLLTKMECLADDGPNRGEYAVSGRDETPVQTS